MNLVGPRPHPVTNLAELARAARGLHEQAIPYYSMRCAVPPGITGWAQVRYRYANSLEEEMEKVRYDLYYVKHMSLWLDVHILFETLKAVAKAPERERRSVYWTNLALLVMATGLSWIFGFKAYVLVP